MLPLYSIFMLNKKQEYNICIAYFIQNLSLPKIFSKNYLIKIHYDTFTFSAPINGNYRILGGKYAKPSE